MHTCDLMLEVATVPNDGGGPYIEEPHMAVHRRIIVVLVFIFIVAGRNWYWRYFSWWERCCHKHTSSPGAREHCTAQSYCEVWVSIHACCLGWHTVPSKLNAPFTVVQIDSGMQ